MSMPLDLSKPNRTIHVGVILTGGETEILDVAPIDLFSGMSKEFIESSGEDVLPPAMKAQALDVKFHWVSEAGPEKPSQLTSGISLNPTDSFETCPTLDVALVGAHKPGYDPNEAELNFVRKTWKGCSAFLTICGGVDVARQAGILEGKTATGPRFWLDMFRRQSPGTNWVEKRWVRDGKLWTSGALLNGTDMMHNFAAQIWGTSDESSLACFAIRGAAWPNRDVDYKDVPWSI